MKIKEACQILKAISGRIDIQIDEDTAKRITAAKRVFTRHYKKEPRAFIEDYIRIIHGKTTEECDFILNAAQVSLVDSMKDNRFVAAPKARQLGITTLTNALALHHSLFAKNASVVCMAVKTDNSNENLRRIKAMFKSMPKWVQLITMEWDEGQGHQNNMGLWSFRSLLTGTQNKLEVASASSEDATRGKTPTFLHWTECAFSDVAEQIFTSIYPALNRRKDSVIVLESTGNGNSGFYYEVCMGIRKGFKVVFMPWFLDENYRLEGEEIPEDDMEYLKDLMGVAEIPHHLDQDQLRWYKATSETIGKAKGQQEYPVNVEQVFMATNSSFFSVRTTQKLKGEPALHTLTMENGYLTQRPGASGIVYEQPRPEYEYLMGVDTSEGQHDPTVITILNPKGEEVLFWREKILPDDIVKLVDILGKMYNNALVACESNGIGMHIILNLQSQYLYPNLYQYEGKVGFRTSVANKPTILATLQDSILSDKLKFRNLQLGQEMPHFEAEKLKAKKGEFDDTVMSCAIASYAFKTNKPKMRYVEETYADYTREVYGSQKPRRRFII